MVKVPKFSNLEIVLLTQMRTSVWRVHGTQHQSASRWNIKSQKWPRLGWGKRLWLELERDHGRLRPPPPHPPASASTRSRCLESSRLGGQLCGSRTSHETTPKQQTTRQQIRKIRESSWTDVCWLPLLGGGEKAANPESKISKLSWYFRSILFPFLGF